MEYRSAGLDNEVNYLSTKRTHPIIYILLTNKYCTYYELKYELDIDDMLDLYEICMCNIYNKNSIIQNAREKRGGQ